MPPFIDIAMLMPRPLAAACQKNAVTAEWFRRLPDVLYMLQNRWSLRFEAPFEKVSCAWVAPVLLSDKTSAVLKLGMPHLEGEQEIAGLRFWHGDPTVELLNADDEINALLLERCEPGSPLSALPEVDQDAVIAQLLRRLWRVPAAPHGFRPLSAMTTYWSAMTLAQSMHWADGGLVSEGLHLFSKLSEPADTDVLLATDLHAGNVLRAQRKPWLVIDPKPFVGDPAYDVTQHLLNCQARLRTDSEGTIRRLAELHSLDYERIRLWTFARAAVEAGDNWRDPRWIELARIVSP